MTVYNKLKIAILAIMTSQTVSAITIDPIQVQSGSGDLLYAEMKFSHANPNEKIEVGLASAEDIMNIGVATQAPGHLNFYTRRSGDGSGVIVITSSRPMIDSELNILLKIKEGNATHLKQIKAALTRNRSNPSSDQLSANNNEKVLTPQIIVSEKDIALNLPSSTHYQINTTQVASTNSITAKASTSSNIQQPLVISVVAPPTLQIESEPTIATQTVNNQPSTPSNNTQTKTNASTPTVNTQNLVQQTVVQAQPKQQEQSQPKKLQASLPKPEEPKADQKQVELDKPKPESAKSQTQQQHKYEKPSVNKQADAEQRHIVQTNESLWKIASKVANETNQSVPEVMRQIKANNTNAFIQGDVNRIRRGAALNLAASYRPTPRVKLNHTPEMIITKKQSGSAKYRLDQAEMSLIADNEQNSAQGSSNKNTQMNQTTTELSAKVMTSREKTVKLQKDITQLATALKHKNQRIQVLNARLAELQQQLQQQNVKKPNS